MSVTSLSPIRLTPSSSTLSRPSCSYFSVSSSLRNSSTRSTDTLARSEEHTSELQSLMRISYAVFCLKKKTHKKIHNTKTKEHTHEYNTKHNNTSHIYEI